MIFGRTSMNKIILIGFVISLLQVTELYSQGNKVTDKRDLINTPIIDIVPSLIILEKDTSQFVVFNVSVLNRGVGILNISKIAGSCYCSNGVIEKNDVRFLDSGLLRLEINKEGIHDEDDTIMYTVNSNAKNSPYYITVKFIDSKKIKIPDEK